MALLGSALEREILLRRELRPNRGLSHEGSFPRQRRRVHTIVGIDPDKKRPTRRPPAFPESASSGIVFRP
jgi:hypothetical protein